MVILKSKTKLIKNKNENKIAVFIPRNFFKINTFLNTNPKPNQLDLSVIYIDSSD
jgi:hypothetical protein